MSKRPSQKLRNMGSKSTRKRMSPILVSKRRNTKKMRANITLGFSRSWNTPRTRAQEVLENLGGITPLKRAYKVIRISDDGKVISMKDRPKMEFSE